MNSVRCLRCAASTSATRNRHPTRFFSAIAQRHRHELISSMLRVDQAGEVAAVEIYRGQQFVLKGSPKAALLQEMRTGEEAHLETVEQLMREHRVRPSALLPAWRAAGFILGVASAALGEKSAWAATVAIETSIGAHYNDQVRTLVHRGATVAAAGGDTAAAEEANLARVFAQHRDEEMGHHDAALALGAKSAPGFALMQGVIQAGCAVAIAIAKRI